MLTCVAVRQKLAAVDVWPAAHSILFGCQWQPNGSEISPSLVPSSASQALTTAACSGPTSAAVRIGWPLGPVLASVFQAWKKMLSGTRIEAGAPAMMPSKSAG